MPVLSLRLFGTFETTRDGVPITDFGYAKVRALLAYLAVETDRPQLRSTLAALLWQEQPEITARKSLSQALFRLRRALQKPEPPAPFAFLRIERESIQLAATHHVEVDCVEFRELVSECRAHLHPQLENCTACLERLERAVELYRGDFLRGFFVEDAEPFEQWATVQRETFHREALDALRVLTDHALAGQMFPRAIGYARRQLELEPWRQVGHAQLMQALALNGERDAALTQFETCRQVLLTEVGDAPSEETTQLFEKIKRGELGATGNHPPGAAVTARRQLTVLAVGLDLLSLYDTLDPEEVQQIVRAYEATCGDVARRYEGYLVSTAEGEGQIYFGFPVAQEDAALRAVRCGMELVSKIQELAKRMQAERGIVLTVNAAVHTGLVVIDQRQDRFLRQTDVSGVTIQLAKRLRQDSPRDILVVSATTEKLVRAYIESEPLADDKSSLRELMPIVRVLRVREAQDYLDAAAAQGRRLPLVGRTKDLAQLLAFAQAAQHGRGQLVLVTGEAGIGKSRLVGALEGALTREHTPTGFRWIECHATSSVQAHALYPVIELLYRLLNIATGDPPAEQQERIEAMLTTTGLEHDQDAALLADFLSLPLPEDAGTLLENMTAAQKRRRLFALVVEFIHAKAQLQPLVLVVQDVHWLDPSTVEFLNLLAEEVAASPLLLLCTARPEFDRALFAGVRARGIVNGIALEPLTQSESQRLIENVVGNKQLPLELQQQLIVRTGGNPLYLEELAKAVLESGELRELQDRYEFVKPSQTVDIPATLQDSLNARLDRLGTAKTVAQWGATIGRTFWYELLQAVTGFADALLDRELERLVAADLIYPLATEGYARSRRAGLEEPGSRVYIFKHALIREATHESLLKRQRQEYHARIAEILVTRFPEIAATRPELLAQHYAEANLAEPAIECWLRAADRAMEQSAYVEALHLATRALAVLMTLGKTPDHLRQELRLQMMLAVTYSIVRGYAAPEIERACARARELVRELDTALGSELDVSPVLYSLKSFYFNTGKLRNSLELGQEMLDLGERTGDSGMLVRGHFARGYDLYFHGDFVGAHRHLEACVALYDAHAHAGQLAIYGNDLGVDGRAIAGLTNWFLGDTDRAVELMDAALVHAQRFPNSYRLATALFYGSWLHQLRRDVPATLEFTARVIPLATELVFPNWLGGAKTFRGWALVEQGQVEEGITEIHQGAAIYRSTGATVGLTVGLGTIAESFCKANLMQEGMDAVSEALALVHQSTEHIYESELYRMLGELLKQSGDPVQARANFLAALERAQQQHARSWELRARASLEQL